MTGDIAVEAYHQQEGCGKLYVNRFAVDDSGTFHIGLPAPIPTCVMFLEPQGPKVHASPLSLYLGALVDAPLSHVVPYIYKN